MSGIFPAVKVLKISPSPILTSRSSWKLAMLIIPYLPVIPLPSPAGPWHGMQ